MAAYQTYSFQKHTLERDAFGINIMSFKANNIVEKLIEAEWRI